MSKMRAQEAYFLGLCGGGGGESNSLPNIPHCFAVSGTCESTRLCGYLAVILVSLHPTGLGQHRGQFVFSMRLSCIRL
jgi:hypothetical protein